MIALLLNTVFFTWNVLFSLATRAIFTFAARLIVLVIQKFKTPVDDDDEARGLPELAADFFKPWIGFAVGFLKEALAKMAFTGLDLLKDGVVGCVTGTGSAIAELTEKTRESFQGVFDASEVYESFSEMISTMFQDFWNHSKDAIGYVMENIAN